MRRTIVATLVHIFNLKPISHSLSLVFFFLAKYVSVFVARHLEIHITQLWGARITYGDYKTTNGQHTSYICILYIQCCAPVQHFNPIPCTLFFHSFILTRLKGASTMPPTMAIHTILPWISINRIEPELDRHLIMAKGR